MFGARLAASPCLGPGGWPLTVFWNARSAAEAFNTCAQALPPDTWLIWAHQDVHLPAGFDAQWARGLHDAGRRWPRLGVAGVYGLGRAAPGAPMVRAGRLLDRGAPLHEPTSLPHPADSLDELLVAVRLETGLRMDPALGWDFYATDLALQARAVGWEAAVVDAWCEHWSGLPYAGALPAAMRDRIKRSAAAFESKWQHQLPLSTPCFEIGRPGDVARFLDQHSHDA